MFITLRKFLVIFLAMLQLIAPLVHAHAGQKSLDLGLHVPGLEMYGIEHEDHIFRATSVNFSPDGIVVGVDAGMKDKRVNVLADLDISYYLLQATAFNVAYSLFDSNFPSEAAQLACRLLIPSLSPRAPPAS
jgi:hypothetical protein